MLKYNTLYQSLKKVSAEWHAGQIHGIYYWSYIKFFDDGTLIEAIVNSDNLPKINLNFTKDASDLTMGTFLYDDKQIIIHLSKSLFKGGFTKEGLLIQNQKDLTWDFYRSI